MIYWANRTCPGISVTHDHWHCCWLWCSEVFVVFVFVFLFLFLNHRFSNLVVLVFKSLSPVFWMKVTAQFHSWDLIAISSELHLWKEVLMLDSNMAGVS